MKKKIVEEVKEVVVEEVKLTDEEQRMKLMVEKAAENQLLAQKGNRFGQ